MSNKIVLSLCPDTHPMQPCDPCCRNVMKPYGESFWSGFGHHWNYCDKTAGWKLGLVMDTSLGPGNYGFQVSGYRVGSSYPTREGYVVEPTSGTRLFHIPGNLTIIETWTQDYPAGYWNLYPSVSTSPQSPASTKFKGIAVWPNQSEIIKIKIQYPYNNPGLLSSDHVIPLYDVSFDDFNGSIGMTNASGVAGIFFPEPWGACNNGPLTPSPPGFTSTPQSGQNTYWAYFPDNKYPSGADAGWAFCYNVGGSGTGPGGTGAGVYGRWINMVDPSWGPSMWANVNWWPAEIPPT